MTYARKQSLMAMDGTADGKYEIVAVPTTSRSRCHARKVGGVAAIARKSGFFSSLLRPFFSAAIFTCLRWFSLVPSSSYDFFHISLFSSGFLRCAAHDESVG